MIKYVQALVHNLHQFRRHRQNQYAVEFSLQVLQQRLLGLDQFLTESFTNEVTNRQTNTKPYLISVKYKSWHSLNSLSGCSVLTFIHIYFQKYGPWIFARERFEMRSNALTWSTPLCES